LNNPRANIANLVAAAGGAILILSTFLGFIGGGDESVSAWELFSVTDIVLVLIGIAALALGAAGATGNAASLPNFLKPSLLKWLGTVALTTTLLFAIELTSGDASNDLKFGAILGVLASAAILAGGILNDRPDLAAKLNEATAGIGSGGGPGAGPGPAGPGPGAGPGAGPGTPAAGAPPAGPGPGAAAPAPAASEPQQPATAPQAAASPAGEAGSSGPAPGWYPDPQGQKRLRYWDGGRWTEQTAD
jgi:hypothetical protein